MGAEVTVEFAEGTRVGPVGPGEFLDESGITIIQYEPGQEFYPWQSTGGDRAVWIRVQGHEGPGSVRVRAVEPDSGHFDLYGDLNGGDFLTSSVTFIDHLVSGRLTDYSSTTSAIVVGAHVARHQYTDIDGIIRDSSSEGLTGDLYFQSSGGPTRDGRLGVDITAAGHNVFAALAQNSSWATGRWNMVQDGGGWYVRGGATSGSAPVVVGAVALMLELKPDLTADQVRAILRDTAVSDTATGTTPNPDWGFGKLNLSGAIGAVQRLFDVPDRGGFTQTFGFTEEVEDQAYTAGTAITPLVLPEAVGGEGEITYRVSELPAGLSFDDSTRTISGTPEAATDGAIEVTYTAEDSTGAAATLTFSITVNPALSFGDLFDLFN